MWGWFLGIAFIFGVAFADIASGKSPNTLAAGGLLILTLASLAAAVLFGLKGL